MSQSGIYPPEAVFLRISANFLYGTVVFITNEHIGSSVSVIITIIETGTRHILDLTRGKSKTYKKMLNLTGVRVRAGYLNELKKQV